MTQHNHAVFYDWCYRCQLSHDEMVAQHRENGCKLYDEKLARCTCPEDDE